MIPLRMSTGSQNIQPVFVLSVHRQKKRLVQTASNVRISLTCFDSSLALLAFGPKTRVNLSIDPKDVACCQTLNVTTSFLPLQHQTIQQHQDPNSRFHKYIYVHMSITQPIRNTQANLTYGVMFTMTLLPTIPGLMPV